LRLSRFLRQPSSNDGAVPLRRVLLWTLVGVALVVGLLLYFRYERQIAPLLGQ
jgi:hypothetical protein